MENHIEDILVELKNRDIRFIVCGGVAAVLHGVERMTMNIDISLDMDKGNLERFISTMKKMNLKPRVPIPPESILDPRKREKMITEKNAPVFTFIDPHKPYRQIDMFLEEARSYKHLIRHTEKIRIGHLDIDVLSIEKLMEMKKEIDPPRGKDLLDIKELQSILERKESND